MTKLLTYSTFDTNPKELFKKIESNYYFGKQKNNRTEIVPYFIITDGQDIIVSDDGVKRKAGFSFFFNKRPTLFHSRFWNRGPREFSQMMSRFVMGAFLKLTEATPQQEWLKDVSIIETLAAIYSIDKKHVLPIYILQLPNDKPLGLTFNLKNVTMLPMSIDEFIVSSTTGVGNFDTFSSAIAFLIAMKEIAIPHHTTTLEVSNE